MTPAAGPAILVVDDDEYVHATVAAALRGMNVSLVRSATAEDGRRAALEARPVLAFVDLGLPDGDGYALTRQLRAEPALAGLAIVILTGHLPDAAAAEAAGAAAIVGKPFRLVEIRELVRARLREARAPTD